MDYDFKFFILLKNFKFVYDFDMCWKFIVYFKFIWRVVNVIR